MRKRDEKRDCNKSLFLCVEFTYRSPNYSHPVGQSSSANQTSLRSSSLELCTRPERNGRFRLGLRTGISYI